MSVRIKVRINGAAAGAVLKIEPDMTSKAQLIGDGLNKLGLAGRDVNMGEAKLYLTGARSACWA